MERFELPEGWEWTTLGKAGKVISGGTPAKSNSEFWDGDIPWVSPKDMKRLSIDDAELKVTSAAVEKSSVRLIPDPAVLFVVRGGILARKVPVATTGRPVTINQDMKAIIPREGLRADFLACMMRGVEGDLLRMVDFSGHGVHKLETSRWVELPIPLPPLPEQARLVARIEAFTQRIQASRKIQQETTAEVENMFERAMNIVFSEDNMADWPEYSVGELFSMVSGQVNPRQPPYIDLPSVAPDNVEKGTGRLIGAVKTAGELELSSGKYLFGSEHVIYSKIRPALRKVCIPRFAGVCSADMYALKANSDLITQDFLALSLLSPPFTNYAVDNSDRNAMPKINRKVLFGYRMKVPDLPTQAKLTAYLLGIRDRAVEIAQLQKSAGADLEALMPTILDRAFRGEL
jgi:type I restriction enzyme S subunit